MQRLLSEIEKGNFIFNLDIDYFFTRCGSTEIQMFSDDYLEYLLSPISAEYKKGNISVITISLSPECSGEWEKAITTCDKVCKIMDIPFNVEMI
ncbi:hypothetical protein [Desulfosporosinus sp. BICA1-9]|uniref:hypothetical protein n=1 Tax=Desulfosporosinus sp. BICA1-9 TaxID=1531958 RepID=UPI000A7FD3B9|nr:hypothetical protein [Desulfosporosinus sp. BICA1-9]